MSEYKFVEKPFLDQLDALGWQVIDQGAGIPGDPTVSLRSSFREWVLKDELFTSLDAINQCDDETPWLTDAQKEEIYDDLTGQSGGLIEANQAVQELLYKYTVDENEVTGEKSPDVRVIDFNDPDKNRFVAINQFRIDTPGRVKSMIIPDIVLFVNGLPLVVIEAKDGNAFTANPMSEARMQLWRYSNQREETKEAGLKEGEEGLFHFNQFVVTTTGEEAEFGTITALDEKYFYAWKSIYPEENAIFTPPLGKERQQETLIQGMLVRATLLDIVRNFILFMQVGGNTIKVAPRYQQYRAVGKIVKRLQAGETADERSGVIWHTQGSGKSLTMVFLIRKLRRLDDLKDMKVLMVNDRTDLEDQLSGTASLTGEKVYFVDSSKDLKTDLKGDQSTLHMVMIHKFMERETDVPDYLEKAIAGDAVPKFKHFGLVNGSDRILILIDEAHRTQSSDLGNNLFEAFPNASRIAFTGTPLITERHKEKTIERFGGRYLDTYKLKDAEADGATVKILYEGKTADTAIKAKHEFDRKFEDLFKDRAPEELAAIKKRYGAIGDVFEAEQRIQEISDDLVEHYATKILPNGFKAQLVCHSKNAAITYEKCLRKSIPAHIDKLKAAGGNEELIEQLEFLKTAVVISSDGTNEKAVITEARKRAKEQNAVENFKKAFNPYKPETGVGILIVCDMLLTGFDAPVEQVMYLDKKISEHNLLQAIARVNRVYPDKPCGYIVDYVGLSNHLRDALSIYSAEDQAEILDTFKGVESEIPVLEVRYRRLIQLFEDAGVKNIQAFVEQKISDAKEEYQLLEEILDTLEDVKRRETFNVYLKKFLGSLDVVMPNTLGRPFTIPAKRFGYIHAKAKQRFKDDSISIAGAGAKVRKLIDEHLIGLGINPKIPPTELLSDTFIVDLDKNKSAKSKASEMEHAIRKHCKIHFEEDPAFYKTLSEKLDNAIQKHKDKWDQLCLELLDIREKASEGRTEAVEGLNVEETPFFDLARTIAFNGSKAADEELDQLKSCVRKMFEEFHSTIDIVNFWQNDHEIKKLRSSLTRHILLSKVDKAIDAREKIVSEIMSLAKVRHEQILGQKEGA